MQTCGVPGTRMFRTKVGIVSEVASEVFMLDTYYHIHLCIIYIYYVLYIVYYIYICTYDSQWGLVAGNHSCQPLMMIARTELTCLTQAGPSAQLHKTPAVWRVATATSAAVAKQNCSSPRLQYPGSHHPWRGAKVNTSGLEVPGSCGAP